MEYVSEGGDDPLLHSPESRPFSSNLNESFEDLSPTGSVYKNSKELVLDIEPSYA